MNVEALDKICADILRESEYDYVGLWEITNAIERDLKPTSLKERRILTLQIIRCLLAGGLEAVNLTASGPGCIPWQEQDVESILRRIDDEWNALGHEPDIGDIVWFNPRSKQQKK